ncbi:homocysteine S-methyltransferase family protein, partial [Escherichia coli]|uniref:homocysteine S-methyltransferase family protein n=1 Tax=Escherichia coli TaxID=562 RepID=UPI003D9BF37C
MREWGWGTVCKRNRRNEADCRGERLVDGPCYLKGNYYVLVPGNPEVNAAIRVGSVRAGADTGETSTWNSTSIELADCQMGSLWVEFNFAAARLARIC